MFTIDLTPKSNIDLAVFVRRMYRKYGPRFTRNTFRLLRLAHYQAAGMDLKQFESRAPAHLAPTNQTQLIMAMTDILCVRTHLQIEQVLSKMDDQAAEMLAAEQQGAFRIKEVK